MKFKPNIRQLLLNKMAAEGRYIEQQEVARDTSLPDVTISRWMNTDGFQRIEPETTLKLAKYFGVEWHDLFTIIEDVDDNPETKTYSTPIAIPA